MKSLSLITYFLQLMADALYANNILECRDLPVLVSRIVCSSDSMACMGRECGECLEKKAVSMNNICARNISYFQWERTRDEDTHFVSTTCLQVSLKFQSA